MPWTELCMDYEVHQWPFYSFEFRQKTVASCNFDDSKVSDWSTGMNRAPVTNGYAEGPQINGDCGEKPSRQRSGDIRRIKMHLGSNQSENKVMKGPPTSKELNTRPNNNRTYDGNRRKSCDCTYQILRFSGDGAGRTSIDNSLRPPATEGVVFPSLANNTNTSPFHTVSNTPRSSAGARERRLSGGNDLFSTRNGRCTPQMSSNPQFAQQRKRRDRSLSVDFGYVSSASNINSVHVGRRSPVPPNCQRYTDGSPRSSRLGSGELTVEAHWNGNTNNPDRNQIKASAYRNMAPSFTPRRSSQSKLRAASVCSPSSGDSGDKQTNRLQFVARRRRSVPIIRETPHASEFDKSPEFYQAYQELKGKALNNPVTKVTSEPPAPSLQSTSSVGSVKDVTSTRLVPIEEVLPEVPTLDDVTAQMDKNVDQRQTTQTAWVGDKRDTSNFDNIGNDFDGDVVSIPNTKIESRSKESVQGLLSHISSSVTVGIDKVNDHNSSGQLIASKDGVQYPSQDATSENHRNYFEKFEDDDDDDVIQDEILGIPDDDLSDEDLQRKRIILWLRTVQTGEGAEQRVRDDTPPPSPDPNHQTAIVVVYQEK